MIHHNMHFPTQPTQFLTAKTYTARHHVRHACWNRASEAQLDTSTLLVHDIHTIKIILASGSMQSSVTDYKVTSTIPKQSTQD